MIRHGDGDARSRSRAGLALGLVLTFVVSGCQTTMSLEEARTVAASFSGAPELSPPRSINDIMAIVEATPSSRASTSARALVHATPPATTDRPTLAQFYFQRGLAARQLGRARQEREDLTRALEYTDREVGATHRLLYELAVTEFSSGSLTRSIEYRRKALDAVPYHDRGWLIPLNSSLAQIHVGYGDLAAAEGALGETSRVFNEFLAPFSRQAPQWLTERPAYLAHAEAAVLQAKGDLADADALYRSALAILTADPVWSRDIRLDIAHHLLARNLILQGRLVEAEAEARRAVLGALAKRGRDSPHTAFVLRGLAWAVLEQGRYREAENLARTALAIYDRTQTAPESFFRALARGHLAVALELQGREREALAEYQTIHAELAGDPESLQRYFRGHPGYAAVLTRTGFTGRALEVLEAALERRGPVAGEPYRATAELRGYLARAHAAHGDLARALREFREVAPLLGGRAPAEDEVAGPRAADHRLADILGAYVGLLADVRGTPLEVEAGIDATAEGFRLADVARGRSVQRALGATAARAAAGNPTLADLVRREQDVRRQLAARRTLLARSIARTEPDSKAIADLRDDVQTLQQVVEVLTARIERDFPAYAQLIDPRLLDVHEARALLHEDEALIAILVTRDRTFVWAVPRRGSVAFAVAPVGAEALQEMVGGLRRALEPSARTLGDIPDFDIGLAHRLFSLLLDPVRSGWEQARRLVVVPHGALSQLPLALLPTAPVNLPADPGPLFSRYRRVPWLVRTHAVTVLPSVAALATLRALPPPDPDRRPFVGFGDPHFSREQAALASSEEDAPPLAAVATRAVPISLRSSPTPLDSARLATLPRLPDTAEEIRGLARAMDADPVRDVFLGARANEKAVKALDLARYRVVAFATHGLVPGDLDGLVQPALALSAPDVAGVDGDGLLTMAEILGLRLDADWVVLSACNTASGQGAGSEAVSGLGRAFFYAGARALLVSNWPVESTSARALTTELFRRQRQAPDLDRARALQQAMTSLIDRDALVDASRGTVVFSYAHPIFWAPFTLIGDSSGEAR